MAQMLALLVRDLSEARQRLTVAALARRGIDAYQAIRTTLQGQSVIAPG